MIKSFCPFPGCKSHCLDLNLKHTVRFGFYYRKSDQRKIRRYRCKECGRTFSKNTARPEFRQKKRQLNESVRDLLCSNVSQRSAARILSVNRKTIIRKFRFLAAIARTRHRDWIEELKNKKMIDEVQFDDLETSEHTKCKPLSVALAVTLDRKILAFQVSAMPAKGLLAAVSVKKYGKRVDQRTIGWTKMFDDLKGIVSDSATFTSDENPHYPLILSSIHPNVIHRTVKGKRGCITGQGELKKIGRDPLFALNHTCAMFRANMSRLIRRTWCTTKNRQGLIDHISLYVEYHNRVLT